MANNNFPKVKDRTIDRFKSKLTGGGARPNLFEVALDFPEGTTGDAGDVSKDFNDKVRFLVKAANLPASNITPIDVPFRGRNLKIAGDRTFDVWTITVINDGDFRLREAFERWANFIIKVSDGSGTITPTDYFADWVVNQLGRASTDLNTRGDQSGATLPVLRRYKMHGCWPSLVSPIELSYDTADTVEEFQVTLQVQWWEAYDGGNSDSVV